VRLDGARIHREVAYIIQRAQQHDARMVQLGPLLFFSTATGDAWMLDTEDALALCLSRDGSSQGVHIIESETQFGIEWDRSYRIEDDLFISVDKSGRQTAIAGYPTREIMSAGAGRR
jgi:hypothetical protein